MAAVVAMSADLVLNLSAFLFIDDMHLRFLALPTATILSGFVNFALLLYGLHRYEIRFDYSDLFRELSKVLAATAVMGLVVYGVLKGMGTLHWPGMKFWLVLIPISVGAGLYFLLAQWFNCRGRQWIQSKGKE
jgi:peptidoglycan biosynthesis protein MviN/MurJ (putative lipid II flippase)